MYAESFGITLSVSKSLICIEILSVAPPEEHPGETYIVKISVPSAMLSTKGVTVTITCESFAGMVANNGTGATSTPLIAVPPKNKLIDNGDAVTLVLLMITCPWLQPSAT